MCATASEDRLPSIRVEEHEKKTKPPYTHTPKKTPLNLVHKGTTNRQATQHETFRGHIDLSPNREPNLSHRYLPDSPRPLPIVVHGPKGQGGGGWGRRLHGYGYRRLLVTLLDPASTICPKAFSRRCQHRWPRLEACSRDSPRRSMTKPLTMPCSDTRPITSTIWGCESRCSIMASSCRALRSVSGSASKPGWERTTLKAIALVPRWPPWTVARPPCPISCANCSLAALTMRSFVFVFSAFRLAGPKV